MSKIKQGKPYKHRKWNHDIPWTTIKSAYTTRGNTPSHLDLAKEFNVDSSMISRRASKEGWLRQRELYWRKQEVKIQQKISDRDAERLINNLNLIAGAKGYLVKLIRENKLKGSVDSIDKLIRLEEFLHGNVDSRSESNVNNNYPAILQELMRQRMIEHEKAKEMEDAAIKPKQLMPPKDAN